MKLDEKLLVKLLKERSETGNLEQVMMEKLFIDILKTFGISVSQYSSYSKGGKVRNPRECWEKNICIKKSCGQKKLLKQKDKYVCGVCDLEFDSKTWDDTLRAIKEAKIASGKFHDYAQKIQDNPRFKYHSKDFRELETQISLLAKKYGKEPWWNSQLIDRVILGWRY